MCFYVNNTIFVDDKGKILSISTHAIPIYYKRKYFLQEILSDTTRSTFKVLPSKKYKVDFFHFQMPFILYNSNFGKWTVDRFFFFNDCLTHQKRWIFWSPILIFPWCLRLNIWIAMSEVSTIEYPWIKLLFFFFLVVVTYLGSVHCLGRWPCHVFAQNLVKINGIKRPVKGKERNCWSHFQGVNHVWIIRDVPSLKQSSRNKMLNSYMVREHHSLCELNKTKLSGETQCMTEQWIIVTLFMVMNYLIIFEYLLHNLNSVSVQQTFVFMEYRKHLSVQYEVCVFLPLWLFFLQCPVVFWFSEENVFFPMTSSIVL